MYLAKRQNQGPFGRACRFQFRPNVKYADAAHVSGAELFGGLVWPRTQTRRGRRTTSPSPMPPCRRCPLKRNSPLRKKSKKQGHCCFKCQLGIVCGHILLYPHEEGGFREQGRSSICHIRAYLTAITKNSTNSRAINSSQAK